MLNYKAPKAIFSLDGEFFSTCEDAAILDTGIAVYILNEDGLTYTLKRWYQHLDGINGRDTKRSASRRARDWWLTDARGDWHPDEHTVAYINMPADQLPSMVGNYSTDAIHRMHLVRHAMFVQKCMEDFKIDKLDFVVCAKGPDTDCIIYNNAFAMNGIDFNYRFARFSSIRDVERALGAFHAGGMQFTVAEREQCSIPFAPKDYYSSGAYTRPGASDNEYHMMPPANPHVGLYDAWLEGNDAAEYYTILNHIAAGRINELR